MPSHHFSHHFSQPKPHQQLPPLIPATSSPSRPALPRPSQHNALFAAVLRSLRFDVLDASARVVQATGPTPPPGAERALPAPRRTPSRISGICDPPLPQLQLSGHHHHILLVFLEGRTWLVDVGWGGDSPPLPVPLPLGAEQYAVPPPADTAADAYRGCAWAAGLPMGRMSRYRVRLGLPGSFQEPDPASTPHFAQRAG